MAEDVCLVCKTGCYYLGMDMLKGVEGVAFCQHLECWVVKYGAFGFHEKSTEFRSCEQENILH